MKKQLAIKGHKNRGTEVIEILEMIGGKNNGKWNGNSINMFYFVDEKGFIDGLDTWNDRNIEFDVFTLEKFLEKFPYKIGDKVTNDNYSGYGIITTMVWDSDDWCVKYRVEFEDFGVIEWFKYNEIKISDIRCHTGYIDQLHELCVSKLSTLMIDSEVCGDEVEIVLNGYEIEVRGDKTYAIKKKPKYPETYEECCGVLGMTYDFPDIRMVSTDEYILYSNFIQLIRCRDAYWKIAGEQMGLGEPWKPDWTDNYQKKWLITFYQDEINFTNGTNVQFILAFPTEEMRDLFFKNFKELIEKCKELI
jgi:hypothetical protein